MKLKSLNLSLNNSPKLSLAFDQDIICFSGGISERKTTSLNLLKFALTVINGRPVNYLVGDVYIEATLYKDDKEYLLQSHLHDSVFTKEELYCNKELVNYRNDNPYLRDDVSIMCAFTMTETVLRYVELEKGRLLYCKEYPMANMVDETIEQMSRVLLNELTIKYTDGSSYSFSDLNKAYRYLTPNTICAINLLACVGQVDYVLVDDLHLDGKILEMVLEVFKKNNIVLICTSLIDISDKKKLKKYLSLF